ncbi:DUF1684 domain-containing protein [Jejudonia soesokkakensis]|uniref:DUF1684 domain-containing protein n=1 Tax=Jejudonia soesokkakensis TaxID=1323432 RepID=A0ABW2MXC3_9FLAO
MKKIFLFFLLSTSLLGFSQTDVEILSEIKAYHSSENEKFSNSETTILEPKDFKEFKELAFYPIDLKYRVEATFIRTPGEKPFLMPTTTDRLPEYVKYGEVHFTIDGKMLKLNLYQTTAPSEDPEYADYLFLPFTDLTSGEGSYGGGRFMDCHIPEGNTIILDFNKSYNPYCAYSPRYSCPIPPLENHLETRIEAGVKAFKEH